MGMTSSMKLLFGVAAHASFVAGNKPMTISDATATLAAAIRNRPRAGMILSFKLWAMNAPDCQTSSG
jgi:hypothetical protein